jgi:hypothetical protein
MHIYEFTTICITAHKYVYIYTYIYIHTHARVRIHTQSFGTYAHRFT